ncbi:hypothetical protein J6590_068889 [Homalodisca vitripennis]|nr:hypothetical protein J6590_068889 [Homalodisca vitripennis]
MIAGHTARSLHENHPDLEIDTGNGHILDPPPIPGLAGGLGLRHTKERVESIDQIRDHALGQDRVQDQNIDQENDRNPTVLIVTRGGGLGLEVLIQGHAVFEGELELGRIKILPRLVNFLSISSNHKVTTAPLTCTV